MSLKGILGGIDVHVILNSIVQIRARLGFWAHTNVSMGSKAVNIELHGIGSTVYIVLT